MSMEAVKETGEESNSKEEVVNCVEKDKRESPEENKPSYPPLPEEPKGVDKTLLCRVGVRLPDGRRVQRNFFRTDPIQVRT